MFVVVVVLTEYLDLLSDPVVRITSIFPNRDTGPFGPESGGTNITMTGSHLDLTGKNTKAYLQSSFCPLIMVYIRCDWAPSIAFN